MKHSRAKRRRAFKDAMNRAQLMFERGLIMASRVEELEAQIDKLEAKESENDSKTVGIESDAEAREGNDARCEQCWHNTVIGSNLRTSLGRPADDISDQEAGSQPVGKG